MCLATTYFPALIARLLPEPAQLVAYKVWLSVFPPLVPTAAYYLLRAHFGKTVSGLGVVYIIAQPVFLQSPSIARTNIAVVCFAFMLLLMFRWQNWKWRYVALTILAMAIVASHYSVAFITAALFLATWLVDKVIFRQGRRSLLYCAVVIAVLVATWYGSTNTRPLEGIALILRGVTVNDAVVATSQNSTAYINYFDWHSRDKILQAALGITNPDGDKQFQFSMLLLITAWLVVCVTMTGLWKAKVKIAPAQMVMTVLGLTGIAATMLVPYISRIYGIERVFYQVSVLLAPVFVYGCEWIGRKARVGTVVVMAVILLPHLVLMAQYGVIHSLLG